MLNKSTLIAGALAFSAALGGVSIDVAPIQPSVAEAVSADFHDRYWENNGQTSVIERRWKEAGVAITVKEAKDKFEVDKNSPLYKNVIDEVYTKTGAKKLFEKNGWKPLFLTFDGDEYANIEKGFTGKPIIIGFSQSPYTIDGSAQNIYSNSLFSSYYMREAEHWSDDVDENRQNDINKRLTVLSLASIASGQGFDTNLAIAAIEAELAPRYAQPNRALSGIMDAYNEMAILSVGGELMSMRAANFQERRNDPELKSSYYHPEGWNNAFEGFQNWNSRIYINGKKKVYVDNLAIEKPILYIDEKRVVSYDYSDPSIDNSDWEKHINNDALANSDGTMALRVFYTYGKISQAIHNKTWQKDFLGVVPIETMLETATINPSLQFPYERWRNQQWSKTGQYVLLTTRLNKKDAKSRMVIDKFRIPEQYRGLSADDPTVPVGVQNEMRRLQELMDRAPKKAW